MENKSRILIYSENFSKWYHKVIAKIINLKNPVIVISPEKNKNNLISNIDKIKYYTLIDFIPEDIQITKDKIRIDFIRNISKKLFANEQFKTEFIFQDINTWWFVTNYLFAQERNEEFTISIYSFENILNQFKPTKVYIDGISSKSTILKLICFQKKIPFISKNVLLFKFKQKLNQTIIINFAGLKRRLLTFLISIWARKEKNKLYFPTAKSKILFISYPRYFRLDYTINGYLEEHEIYQKNIQLKLGEITDYDFISLELLNKMNDCKFYKLVHKLQKMAEPFPLQYFFNTKLLFESKKTRRLVCKRLKTLFNDPLFKEIFSFKGISIIDVLYFPLLRIFITEITAGLDNFKLSLKALRELEPKMVILHNEEGNFEKSLNYAAKKLLIPTLAIQHGIISSASAGYVLFKDMICSIEESDLSVSCFHIPTFTSIYGDLTKEFLIDECGYLKNRLVVNGCSRWDVIKRKGFFNKNEFMTKLNFNENLPILVVLSSGLFIKSRQQFFYELILEVIKNYFPNTQIIWKPHPSENNNEVSSLVEKYNLTNSVVDKKLPLYDVLNICDLAITVHSTSGLEAMLFDKPVITLIPQGEEEFELFQKSNAVLSVRNLDELVNAINLILNDAKTQEFLKEQRKILINKFVKFDGKASERNAQLIIDIINKKY